jgi:hypothetical protein
MNRSLAATLHVANALVGATGLALGWCVYVAVSEDPDALSTHPWQAPLQHAHILLAPVLVAALGAAWSAHAWPKWSSGARAARQSGVLLAALSLPMIATGYWMQIAQSLEARAGWSLAHGLTSLGWTAASLVHVVRARRVALAAARSTSALDSAPDSASA